jgi:hypothetical protein
MSHAANANCKCSARSSLCVINTTLFAFYFAGADAGEKVQSASGRRPARVQGNLISSLAHLADIPIHRGAAENWGSSLQKLPGAIYGAVPEPPSSQRQQCKFQANYLTIATLSAMTAQRTVQQCKLFAPPLLLLRQLLSMIAR